MAPEDRRDAIVLAAIPLLRERGAAVTTRELADAACVAEGTLFRVFPDKAALLRAAIERALDPTELLAQLSGVEAELPLRLKLGKVVAVLQRHAGDVASLMAVGHEMAAASGQAHPHAPGHGPGHRPGAGGGHHPVDMVVRGVAAVLEPHATDLRFETAVCARVLVGLVLAASRPLVAGSAPLLDPHQLAALFCDGAVLPSTLPSTLPATLPSTSEVHPC